MPSDRSRSRSRSKRHRQSLRKTKKGSHRRRRSFDSISELSASPKRRSKKLQIDTSEVVRLLTSLLQIQTSIGNELLDLFKLIQRGKAIEVDGIENQQVRKKLRHLMNAFGLQKHIQNERTKFSLPKQIDCDLRHELKKHLKTAAKDLGISWDVLKNAEPIKLETTITKDGSGVDVKNMQKDPTIVVDEDGRQLSLMEMRQRGIISQHKAQPISTLGKVDEPWGKSQMEQVFSASSGKNSEKRANKWGEKDSDEDGQPWRRFDREKEIEMADIRKPVTQSQFSSLVGPSQNLAARFKRG